MNCPLSSKSALDIRTEEIGHVQMVAPMIARILDDAPINVQEELLKSDSAVAIIMGDMNPQHAIVYGFGATVRMVYLWVAHI